MKETIKTNIRVPLYRLIGHGSDNWAHHFENFESFLTDAVADEIDRELECFQVCTYFICDHQHDAVIFTVEGFEENE